jgi:hypothetical protein
MNLWHRFIRPILGHFRRRRATWLVGEWPDFAKFKICDLGGSKHFWEESGLRPGNVVILNVSDDVTQSNTGECEDLQVVLYDGEHIPAADREYDLLTCNSVIEHVEPSKRAALCAEMRRVAKRVYLQTPAFEFPVEPHFVLPFVHWLPRKLGQLLVWVSPWYLLSRASKERVRSYFEEIHLMTRSEVQALFPGAEIREESFGLLRKSHLIFWNASGI